MTMYESNRDVHETGAEAGEFVDTPANEPGDDSTPEEDADDSPDAKMYTSEPVETEAGERIIRQQNVGPGNEAGGGEWPDPHTPPVQ
jgi:hypothetical protein